MVGLFRLFRTLCVIFILLTGVICYQCLRLIIRNSPNLNLNLLLLLLGLQIEFLLRLNILLLQIELSKSLLGAFLGPHGHCVLIVTTDSKVTTTGCVVRFYSVPGLSYQRSLICVQTMSSLPTIVNLSFIYYNVSVSTSLPLPFTLHIVNFIIKSNQILRVIIQLNILILDQLGCYFTNEHLFLSFSFLGIVLVAINFNLTRFLFGSELSDFTFLKYLFVYVHLLLSILLRCRRRLLQWHKYSV